MRDGRGQLSLTMVEVGAGLLLILAAVAGFGLGLPDAGVPEARLDAQADDAATVLAADPDGSTVTLTDVARSASSFERTHEALRRRAGRLLPSDLLFALRTPHGTVGYPRPTGRPTGSARIATPGGDVVVEVWDA